MRSRCIFLLIISSAALLSSLGSAARADEWREERWRHEEVHRGYERDWGLSWDCCSPYIGFGAGSGGRVGAGVGLGFPLGLDADRRARRAKGGVYEPKADEYVIDPFAEEGSVGAPKSGFEDAPAWERIDRAGVIDPFPGQP